MTRALRIQLALFVALAAQLVAWRQITRDTDTLQWAVVVLAAVGLVGWVVRRLRMPGLVGGLVQAVVAFAVVVGGVALRYGPDTALDPLRLGRSGADAVLGGAAPLPPHPGVMFLLTLLAMLVGLFTDWLVLTLDRPATAAVGIFTLYAVVAIGLGSAMLLTEFALAALGVTIVLLAAHHGGSTRRWAGATACVAVVTALALALTWAIARQLPEIRPTETRAPLQMSDPSLDLKRNLIQATDDVLLTYRTDQPSGTYLKLATLQRFTAEGFGLQDVRVASGRLPPAPGVQIPTTPRSTQVRIGDFGSEWLPVPYAPIEVEAPGDWGFAVDTLDVMSLAENERTKATIDLEYTVESVDVLPSAEQIAGAASTGGPERERQLELPPQLPSRIGDLAEEITADAPTAGAKAQALEDYLTSDRFTYSLATGTGEGDGLRTIDDFLFSSRRGYCEQFAGAMAIMARTLGIPSRMAVGFVPGDQQPDGSWQVTGRSLHTWPELWLDGLGWVAFEPTPASGVPGIDPDPEPSASPTATASGTPTATAAPSATPTPSPAQSGQPTPTPGNAAAGWVWVVLGLIVVGLGIAAAFVTPRALRAGRRRRRLAGTGDPRADTLSAWEEVRESVTDAGLDWPAGSPRYVAERLAALVEDEAATAALRRLALASERALFDDPAQYADRGTWVDEVGAVIAALGRR